MCNCANALRINFIRALTNEREKRITYFSVNKIFLGESEIKAICRFFILFCFFFRTFGGAAEVVYMYV